VKATTNRKPSEVKRGNVTVKIYSGINRVGGAGYPQFTLTFYKSSRRKKRRFADMAEARREAEFTAEKLCRPRTAKQQATILGRANRESFFLWFGSGLQNRLACSGNGTAVMN
jgi:hypothetical protein